MFRNNWMTLQEWTSVGLPIRSTSSDEAAKLYDAATTQLFGWYDDPSLEGFSGTVNKMLSCDPNFLLARAMALAGEVSGYTQTYHHNENIRNETEKLKAETEQRRSEITEREYQHVQAVIRLTKGEWNEAAQIWENILRDWPTDVVALKMAYFRYIFAGRKQDMLNLISRAYPHLEKSIHSGYIDGMYAFVLEESGHFSEAEKHANKGLEKNPYDGWAVHSLAHVLEMQGRHSEGVDMLRQRANEWARATHISGHNWWHQSLFHVSLDDFDAAMEVFHDQLLTRLHTSQSQLTVCDASSLIYRLSLLNHEKCPQVNRLSLTSEFEKIYTLTKKDHGKHINGFVDTHYLMAILGSGHLAEAEDFVHTLRLSHYAELHPRETSITEQLLQGMIHYEREQYKQCTETLYSIRDQIVHLGASDAQRDVFTQLALASAFKSARQDSAHQDILQQLIKEREKLLHNSNFIVQCAH